MKNKLNLLVIIGLIFSLTGCCGSCKKCTNCPSCAHKGQPKQEAIQEETSVVPESAQEKAE